MYLLFRRLDLITISTAFYHGLVSYQQAADFMRLRLGRQTKESVWTFRTRPQSNQQVDVHVNPERRRANDYRYVRTNTYFSVPFALHMYWFMIMLRCMLITRKVWSVQQDIALH